MGSIVQVKEAVIVTPSEATPVQVLQLSALDSQLFLRFDVEYLMVYRSRQGLDKAATAARIKWSLSRALVPYYPLAGKVRARSDGLGLEVVCRGQGALFIEAMSNYTTVSNFEGAPKDVMHWRKLLSSDLIKAPPPLVVQLTWLADGGATLGIGFKHCLCDGTGSANFLNSFAELATGKRGLGDLKPKPVWDRHLMDSKAFQCNSGPHPEFNSVPDLCGFNSCFSAERLTPTSVTFYRKRLNELKRLMSSQPNGPSFTSFEVLSAHVWRSWAKALRLPSNQILKLLFSVDIRNRVKPSLPSGYYGNAFVLACAQTCAKDLTEKGLRHAAELVKRAKERVGDEYVREVVETVSSAGRGNPDSVGVLIMSQWSRLGLDRVDFGMGRPVHVGPICTDRYCLMAPVYNQREAVKVIVAVPTSSVDQYLHLLMATHA